MTLIRGALRRFMMKKDGALSRRLNQAQAYPSAVKCVSFFYVAQLIWMSDALLHWDAFVGITFYWPLWPVQGFEFVGLRHGIFGMLAVLTAGTLASIFFPLKRTCRFLSFLGIFLYVALINSFGNIHHGLQTWVLTSGLLILLPSVKKGNDSENRKKRGEYLLVIIAVQTLILLPYTLSGFYRIIQGLQDMASGHFGAFAREGFATMIAHRLIADGTQSALGHWMITHPDVSRLLLMMGTLMESLTLLAMFRPSLHRIFGVYLVGMHLFNLVTLNIEFHGAIIVVTIFLIFSPFITPGRTLPTTNAESC